MKERVPQSGGNSSNENAWTTNIRHSPRIRTGMHPFLSLFVYRDENEREEAEASYY